MGIVAHLPAGTIRSLAEAHPQLTRLRARLVDDLHIDPARAGRLISSLVTHAVEDLGDAFLGEMSQRLRKIDSLRGRIAGAVDHVLVEGALPADLDHAALSRLFDTLQHEMEGLQSARRFAESHARDPDIAAITGGVRPTAAPTTAARPFAPTGDPLQGVVGARPPGMLRDAMAAIDAANPARGRLFRSILDQHGDLLGLAVLAETQVTQRAALRDLREVLGPNFPEAKFRELEAAVKELGKAHSRARRGPGTDAGRVRAERVVDLPPELRTTIGGDNTLLGPLAEQFPADLHALWDAWRARGREQDFRDYVFGEMRSGRRPELAEWQAAHDLGTQHGVLLLKDAATFDPSVPGGRRVNPREPGTDIVGLRQDGEIWVHDDKSHRLKPPDRAAGATGLNLSGVSAFEGRALARNMAADAAEMEAALARQAAAGFAPNPRAVEAVSRIRQCASRLTADTAGWSEADFLLPANQLRIRGILDAHRVKLKVSSTMGDVRGMTDRLQGLGIEVLPPTVPAAAPPRVRIGVPEPHFRVSDDLGSGAGEPDFLDPLDPIPTPGRRMRLP